MEGIVAIEKTKEDIERCKKVIQEEITLSLSEEEIEKITIEIMDTALYIGGGFDTESIRYLAKEYQTKGGVERCLERG